MSDSRHRVTFAGGCISIDCDDADSTRIVDQLYGHLRVDPSIPPRATFRLGREASGDFALFCGDTLEYRGPCAGMAAAMLLDRSVHQLAVEHRDGLLLHAGCVARDGKAVILAGASGAGKTTLTAWLARRGFQYLSDELVFLRESSTSVVAFQRPLSVKRDGQAALEGAFAFGDGGPIVETPEGFLISPTLLGAADGAVESEALLLVFLSYREGAQLEMRRLSEARTAMLLLASLVNASQLPELGLGQATELARALPGYSLTWGEIGQIGDCIDVQLEHELRRSRGGSPSEGRGVA